MILVFADNWVLVCGLYWTEYLAASWKYLESCWNILDLSETSWITLQHVVTHPNYFISSDALAAMKKWICCDDLNPFVDRARVSHYWKKKMKMTMPKKRKTTKRAVTRNHDADCHHGPNPMIWVAYHRKNDNMHGRRRGVSLVPNRSKRNDPIWTKPPKMWPVDYKPCEPPVPAHHRGRVVLLAGEESVEMEVVVVMALPKPLRPKQWGCSGNYVNLQYIIPFCCCGRKEWKELFRWE